jgi:predicted metal-dependent enzyme (double-stranded beta helix superfamily)
MSDFRTVDDEYVLDTPTVRAFVADVQAAIAASPSPEAACDAIRPRFVELLADQSWLPPELSEAAPDLSSSAAGQSPPAHSSKPSGMGGGIGQWLLYRADDGSLSLFSLVVPSGSATPVHDHLAWGLVGLYRREQEEEIYVHEHGELRLVERRSLVPGDFYDLLPPRDDIHRVRTTSVGTSVSIHLLTSDTGCVWRHAYDPETGHVSPFRSGYANVACADEPSGRGHSEPG